MMTNWPPFRPLFDSYLLVALIAIFLLSLLLLGPVFRQISRGRRAVLIALRLGVVLLALIFMLCPTWTTTTTRRQSATLLIMFDRSLSMEQPHADNKSRWQAQSDLLKEVEPILSELAHKLEVKIYAFDHDEPEQIPLVDGAIDLPQQPQGSLTDMGAPLRQIVRNERGKRLAGVILLGDGTQTAYDPPVELNQAVGELVAMQYPLYTVSFGQADDAGQGGDVAVEYLPDQYTVFKQNELLVKGMLRVRGFVNKDILVELISEDFQGQTQVVGQTTVRAREDGEQMEAAISYIPQTPGQYQLTLRAQPQDEESVIENNQLTAFLTVLEGGLRVLYLEGELRLEQMFLRRSIGASADIQLDFLWIDHRRRDSWPVDLVDTLKKNPYDAIIIGDLDSSALHRRNSDDKNLETLAGLVEQGMGLIMLGGYHSFGPGGYQHTPLANVLPIRMGQFERQDFDSRISDDLHLVGPLTMSPKVDHFLTRLATGAENAPLWRSLPPLEGANKFAGVKRSSGVAVLAVSQNGAPLLVSGQYGAGRVLAMAGDSTWNWWMQGHKDQHRRFWRQVVLWLTQRDGLTKDSAWVKLAQRRYRPGGQVEFTAGVKNDARVAVADAKITASVISPGGERSNVAVLSAGDHVGGLFDDTSEPGQYTIEISAQPPGKSVVTAQTRFQVFDTNPELTNTAANPDQLARLANMTSQFGGRPVPPEELSNLLKQIQEQPLETEIEVQSRWQLASTWWDGWLFFLALVILLSVEWTLRKAWGLV